MNEGDKQAGREILCRVTTRNFVAGAVFRKTQTGWELVRCAPILGWWRNGTFENIKTFMTGPGRKNGWQWEWIKQ